MVESRVSLARLNAERLRFSGDIVVPSSEHVSGGGRANDDSYQHAIEVSHLLTPDLWSRYASVCDRLGLPARAASLFIYSDRNVQGECLLGRADSCIIRLSSGLVDLLDEEEFEFVVGHELGHFLLDHHVLASSGKPSGEYFRLRRAQEISVDRIGLMACGSLDVALRALMKTVSGLTERHLRFDVRAFIAQLRNVDAGGQLPDLSGSTHPSTVIRAKALLWFSLSNFFTRGVASYSAEEMRKMNARIERDLRKYMEGALELKLRNAKQDLLLWMVASNLAQVGRLSADVQSRIITRFGRETAGKLRLFLGDLSKQDAERVTFEKLRDARKQLEDLAPREFIQELRELEVLAQAMTS